MVRTRSALLALAATMAAVLLSAGSASAATAVIDARDDSPGSRWVPNTVTINAGDTVRWEFDDALVAHNVKSSSANWTLSSENIPPDGTPVEHTFATPGTYTFLCDLHQGMSGTVTVEDPLENVLVFSKTGGFRHDSIPAGIQAIQQLGATNDFAVTATEDAAAFTDANLAQFDVVVFLSTTGEVLNADQQAAFERYIQGGGGYAGIHAASDTEYSWPWYGELVGGYFRSHPPGTPTATVRVEDTDEPSTSGVPATWTRTDEWYNFQDTTEPVVNGNATVADYSPRARHVHVLATVDEATYDEQDGNTVDDDHPVAWCSNFDGGRSWYTAMGHTAASFSEPDFRDHLLGGLQTAAGADAECGERRDPPPVAADFEKVTINDDTKAPMEIAPTPDGRVFYIELGQPKSGGQQNEATAELMVWDPDTGNNEIAHTLTVDNSHENGLLGVTLAPDFATSGHLYMAYSKFDPAAPINAKPNVVSRFTIGPDSKVVPGSEVPIFVWTHQRAQCCHTGGSLAFGADGNLYISTGDNTNPFAHGFNPTDERPGREAWDAQRTSANTNDHNGKVLRIRPRPTPMGTPGIGSTYDIPTGNMFPVGTAQTLPEIYAMGFRNPFRIHVDKETGWVLLGDYGPDSQNTNPDRGPQGSVEYNVVTQPGFYGWPYCIRQNVAYNDITYASDNGNTGTNNGKYNCAAPVNNSPNNTGLQNLPPAQPATMWMAYTETDNRFPGLGTGGAPTGGARYYYQEGAPQSAFPRFYDGHWFIGEWNNDWVKTATLNDKGLGTGVSCFAICSGYASPMDLEFGANGSLYVVEWGQGFAENNADSGVYRIDYVKGGRLPIARATATPDAGPLPLQVQFSSAGSNDPDGTAITYAWDFDGDGDTDSTEQNPVHTYTTAGTFSAKLTVTDETGAVGTDTLTVVAGNTRPVVTVEIPENGRVADFGEKIPYRVSVTDAEDGTTGNGISCNNVQLEFKLGHDSHSHELDSATGCEGVVQLEGLEGHGPDANVFTVITAAYTDRGNGAAGPVTGRGEAIVQPRLKQAEYFQTTGRTADSIGTGTPGVQLEATTDAGGGNAVAFIEDGDWISFDPYNLEELDKVTFRVASESAGANIQLRYDAPDGPLVAETGVFAPTGGWQVWRDQVLELPDNVPAGTHRLYVVFRHPTNTGGLMNLNWFKFAGKGAAITTPPEVTATANPASGTAPLQVAFDAEATDAEGEALTYAWDFGVSGTTADTSTQEDPTYTYERPGNYTATVRVTDAQGSSSTATVDVRATRAPEQCPTGPVRSDEFDGNSLDTERWEVIRPDAANPLSVANGSLKLPIAQGSIYEGGTTAKNIVVQDAPDGEWMATAKVTVDPLTENYHQAGLRVYAGDNNWASVHMIHAGGQRDFEFIWEANGVARNGSADKLGGIPDTAPLTYYVRLVSDGQALRAFYSYDGDTFQPVGQPGSLATFNDPKIGPVALSGDSATTVPNAYFDWIRFEPDGTGGGSEGILDEFDGTALGPDYSVVRQNQALNVSGGALHIPAEPGDIYGTSPNSAQNLVLRDAPDGPWTATAKVAFEGTHQWHQAGMLVYGDDDNFTKLGRLATDAGGNGTEKFEFIYENAGSPRNAAEDSTGNLPANFPRDYYVRIVSDGTNITGAYSTDGNTWTPVGRPAPLPANPRIGLFAFSNAAATTPIADFDWLSIEGEGTGGGGGPAGPSYDDDFEGTALDKQRWNAIVRDVPSEYSVSGGQLRITTSAGDIYTGDTNPPPNNFILQSADHAGADWVIETKIDSATINGGYGQGGLMAYSDGDNYVKFDAISDAGQTRINRLELRSEIAGAIQSPQPADPQIAAGVTEIWLRLTKTGQSYAGEYSLDGQTWTAINTPVTHPMTAPSFGLFAFGPQAAGQGDVVPFEYFTLDGEDPDQCACVSNGDEFDGTSLNKTTWNSIVREDDTKYVVEGGALKVTTVGGDIYQTGDPAPTRNFFLQTPDHADADWVIETKVSGSISGGYEHGGLLAYQDDSNYVKFDLISDDGQTAVNRIEIRSEENDVIQQPQPQITPLPAGTNAAWLRLTKTGDQYVGEYSFDGETWTAFAAVQNDMATPRFGLFTQGVNSPGGQVVFDYFALDGERGCPGQEPENEAPVLGDVTANPTIGLAPLPVQFTADATDADGDELTYSWDFDGNGTADSTTKNASHTYTQAGTYDAKVTVSDGEATATKTVKVQVLPADDPEARFRTLVFSETTGFRHSSIPVGIQAIRELGAANDFQVDATEDSSVFRDGLLAKYDTVVFLSTTGDPLTAEQQAAFERYIRGGGGFTGIHAAADTEYDWNWYGKLVGGYFKSHPPGTPEATVHVEDQEHHSTEGIPTPWERVDEWYNYRSPEPGAPSTDWSPRLGGVHVLMTVDEATYDEQDENATDDDHPISWCQRYDGGRSWYTGMGHTEGTFGEADFRKHLLGGLEVTAGVVEDEACGLSTDITLEAFADPSSGPAPLTVNFSATAMDPDGDDLTYRWEFSEGGSYSGASVSRTYATKGTYTATVTVSDGDGETKSKTLTVQVGDSAPPVFEQAVADRTSGPAPLEVWFHAVARDPDGGKVTYRWEFGDGGAAFGAEAEHTYLEPGTYTAKVIATDPTGASATEEIEITVTDAPGNQPPSVVALADRQSGAAPLAVQFSAEGTDPDGDELAYTWDFGDGTTGTGRRARHTYTANGTYTAKVTADDGRGGTATDEVVVVVGNPAGNQAPTVQVAANRTTGTAPLKVNFSAQGSDPDGDAFVYTWDFKDGGLAGGQKVSHTFSQPGTYAVTVTVKDEHGAEGSATVTITVQPRGQVAGDRAAQAMVRPLSTPSVTQFAKRGLKVAATCAADGKAAVGLWATKKTARKLGLESRGLSRRQLSCVAGETVQLRLKPSRKVRKAIRAVKPKRLVVSVALAHRSGDVVTRKITLKR